MSLTYKFVELSIVSDDMIEKCVNQWVHAGWTFDDIRFVTSNASRRPVMAFVSFVRDDLGNPADAVARFSAPVAAGHDELAAAARARPPATGAAALVSRAGAVPDSDDADDTSASSGAASPVMRSRNALAALIARDEE